MVRNALADRDPLRARRRGSRGDAGDADLHRQLVHASGERSRANTFLILGNPVTVLWMSVVSGYLVHRSAGARCSSSKACRRSSGPDLVVHGAGQAAPGARGCRQQEKDAIERHTARGTGRRSSRCRNYGEAFRSPAVMQAVRAVFLLEHRRVRLRAVAAVDPQGTARRSAWSRPAGCRRCRTWRRPSRCSPRRGRRTNSTPQGVRLAVPADRRVAFAARTCSARRISGCRMRCW